MELLLLERRSHPKPGPALRAARRNVPYHTGEGGGNNVVIMILFRKVSRALVLGLGLWAACTTNAQEIRSGNTQSVASLRLTLTQIQDASARPVFRAELHNAGDEDLILNLGMMLANGKKQYADRIHLLLTDPHGKLLHLDVTGPGFIAGRVDPMVVPLPVGATFVLSIDLKDYSAPKEKIWALDLTPGQYTLSAEYTGVGVPQRAANLDMQGISLMPYWTGTVDSNALPFTLTREIGRRHGP